MSSLVEHRPGTSVPARVIVVFLMVGAAVAVFMPGGFRPLDVRTQLLLGAVAAVLLCLAGLHLISGLPHCDRGLARWRIGPWYLLWGALAFGAASITWLDSPRDLGSASRITLPSVVVALGLFAVATVVWTVGYLVGVPRLVSDAARRGLGWLLRGTGTTACGGATPWVLYGIGTGARLTAVLLSGRYGYLGDPSQLVSRSTAYAMPLNVVAQLTVFAIAAAAYRAFGTASRGAKVTLWSLVAIEAAVGAVSGGKESFVIVVLAVLVPYAVRHGRLPVRILLPGLLLFMLAVVPFNGAYRQAVRADGNVLSPAAALATAPAVAQAVLVPQEPMVVLRGSVESMLRRVRMIDNAAIVTQLTPGTIAYRSPIELASAPVVGLIPRAVWPDKPVFANGYRFSQEYYGTSGTSYTSAAITPLGDLYRHGGVWVVVIGMLLLGMGCRLFDLAVRPDVDPRAICFVLVFLPIVVKSEMDVYALLLSIPAGVMTAVLGARLICRKDRAA